MIVTPEAIKIKVVYYGPGASGKTTSVEHIARALGAKDLVEISESTGRTVFFDYLLVNKEIDGKKVSVSLFTVAGQAVYATTKKLVLNGADGIMFVADSSEKRLQENLEVLRELEVFLREIGMDINYIPLVFQYNKRDLDDALPVEELERQLNTFGVPHFETVALKGEGVLEAFNEMVNLILKNYGMVEER
ncbi:conserved hypothetical protein [Thermosulfidibacter takaii ABI70S6]|uniref:Mutual gliding-motility protein MglA n=1 Tax=Thermosulfidibacter takaii (strain DSM 17441 / JCM 13301 / NBRC 103674 / ABI70S6) TaxID=1298851 RepID=A0A0S3QUZ2_THET7|nr:GTPase domain-containing protein [Thermosulfidibacter takaii]BAT72135.1 conserved hypothetical protein [Thermosulfidibacter takaii ABI70S6]